MTARPSAEEVERALATLDWVAEYLADPLSVILLAPSERLCEARDILRAALPPQRVGAAKDVSLALGVEMGNLDDLRGLPEPWRTLPRPTAKHPDRVSRLWDMDEIEAFAAARRAKREGVST